MNRREFLRKGGLTVALIAVVAVVGLEGEADDELPPP